MHVELGYRKVRVCVCVCTFGIKMSGGIKRKSLIFVVRGDKTWMVVNHCECESPISMAMEPLNLRRDGEKRISVLENYVQKIITPVKYMSYI